MNRSMERVLVYELRGLKARVKIKPLDLVRIFLSRVDLTRLEKKNMKDFKSTHSHTIHMD